MGRRFSGSLGQGMGNWLRRSGFDPYQELRFYSSREYGWSGGDDFDGPQTLTVMSSSSKTLFSGIPRVAYSEIMREVVDALI